MKIKHRGRRRTRVVDKSKSYRERFQTSGFDSRDFIDSCFTGQKAIREEVPAKELITFVIARIKDAMKIPDNFDMLREGKKLDLRR